MAEEQDFWMTCDIAPEPTVIKSVIKHWRAELLEVALQNCPCMRMCIRFVPEPAISYLCIQKQEQKRNCWHRSQKLKRLVGKTVPS